MEEINKEIEQLAKQSGEEKSDGNRQEIEEKKSQLKLLLHINRVDQQLLNQSIAQISRYSNLLYCSKIISSKGLGLPRLHLWTEAFRVNAINNYKNSLPFKQTSAGGKLHGL